MSNADGAPQRASSNGDGVPAPGEFVDGRFIVEHLVGLGGMGAVLAARDGLTGEPRAIKVMLPDAAKNADAVSRFLQEAKACRLLQSEHIAKIFHVGALPNGAPFLVMELLEGKDLGQIITQQGALPIQTAVDLVLQACAAVAEAHQQGIVHRDLKPANFFISTHAGKPHLKVLDFGISKMTNPDAQERVKTNTSFSFGTPVYMSPEQIRSTKNVDARTDVWALGVILHELIAGSLPFEGDTLPSLYAAITADAPHRLRTRRPEAPARLEAVILRCLEKDPQKRMQTVAELARSLTEFASGDSRLVLDDIDSLVGSGKHLTIQLSSALGHPPAPQELTTLPAETRSTVEPWDTSFPQQRGASSRKLAIVAVLVGVFGGLFVVVFFAMGDGAPPAPAASTTASASAVPTETAPPIVTATAAPSATPSAPPKDPKNPKRPSQGLDPLRDRR